eukprot:225598_1
MRSHVTSTAVCVAQRTKINNIEAVRRLKRLQTLHSKDKGIITPTTKRTIIDDAYNIYSQIDGSVNHYVMNTLLNMSFKYEEPHRIHIMWRDICTTISKQKQDCNLSYSLLLKCCIESGNTQRCIQVLLWIERSKYKLKIHDLFIRKLLFQCNNLKYISYIERLIHEKFIENDNKYIKSALITAYGQCNSMKNAAHVFNSTSDSDKDIYMVSAMMKAFINNNNYANALDFYHSIQHIQNDDVTNMLALKACIHIRDMKSGHSIIQDTIHLTTHSDPQLMHTMIEFFGIAHELHKASELFDHMNETKRTIFAFNAMMSAYLHNSENKRVMDLFYDIPMALHKDAMTYSLAIKASDYETGRCIISNVPYDIYQNVQFKTTLIHFYAICGEIVEARKVFDSIEDKQLKHISVMMNAYISNDYDAEALLLYDNITCAHDTICHVLAIKACGKTMNLNKGKEIHALCGDKQSIEVQNVLIDFYGRVQCIDTARDIFESCLGDVVSIGSMMKAYINNNRNEDALSLYDDTRVQLNHVCDMLAIKACTNVGHYDKVLEVYDKYGRHDNVIALLQAIKACVRIDTSHAFDRGKAIHSKTCSVRSSMILNAWIDFYGHYKDATNVRNIFYSMTEDEKDLICMNTTMHSMIRCNQNESALSLYDDMSDTNVGSHVFALKACSNLGKYEKGKEIHQNVGDMIHQSALIDFYGRCLDIDAAEHVFDSIPTDTRNMVTIGAMMNAYVINNKSDDALALYEKISAPDAAAHRLAIKACANTSNYDKGKSIHDSIADSDIQTKTTLIDFYGSCRDMETAQDIFVSIEDEHHNIVSIGALMNAYFVNKMYKECIQLFQNMNAFSDRIAPDILTYRLVLAACSKHEPSVELSQMIHDSIQNDPNAAAILTDSIVESNLIAMYAQNGMMEVCEHLFDEHLCRKEPMLVVANAMLHAYGRNGWMEHTKALFLRMKSKDIYTYSIVLTACSHAGDMEYAEDVWRNVEQPEIKYNRIVITNIVDCCSRKGYLNKAFELVQLYETFAPHNTPRHAMWRAILGGACKHNNKTMAQYAYDEYKLRYKESNNPSDKEKISFATVLLANLYASHSEFDKAEQIRNEMTTNQLQLPLYSDICFDECPQEDELFQIMS